MSQDNMNQKREFNQIVKYPKGIANARMSLGSLKELSGKDINRSY